MQKEGAKVRFWLMDPEKLRAAQNLPEIERGIPFKEKAVSRPIADFLAALEVGDSFLSKTRTRHMSALQSGNKIGVKLRGWNTDEGYRSWVMARKDIPREMPKTPPYKVDKNVPPPARLAAMHEFPVIRKRILQGCKVSLPPGMSSNSFATWFSAHKIPVTFSHENGVVCMELTR